jgi:hypothetical protein
METVSEVNTFLKKSFTGIYSLEVEFDFDDNTLIKYINRGDNCFTLTITHGKCERNRL